MKNGANVQIIGTRKNASTRKAIRFFSDRGIAVHILDLNERALQRRELENITRGFDPMEIVDTESVVYRRGGFAFLDFDPIEELLDHPLLMKMPVVRYEKEVTIGEQPREWARWLGR